MIRSQSTNPLLLRQLRKATTITSLLGPVATLTTHRSQLRFSTTTPSADDVDTTPKASSQVALGGSTSVSSPPSETTSTTSTTPWDSNRLLNVPADVVNRGLLPDDKALPSGTPGRPNGSGSEGHLVEYKDGSTWDELKKLHIQRHGCVVVWIQDGNMRIKDNYPLALGVQKAQQLGIPLVTVYVVDGRTYAQPSSVAGFFRKSPKRAEFALQNVHALRRSLEGKHSTPMLVRTGFPEFIIPDLCVALRARYCFTSSQYAPHENLIETSIRKHLSSKRAEFNLCKEAVELEEEIIRRQAGTAPLHSASTDADDQPLSSSSPSEGEGVPVRCSFQPVWDSTMIHYDDLITPAETMKEGIRWYLEELPACTIRPTGPYDCDDGRLEKLSQQIRERLGSEFSYAVGTSKKKKNGVDGEKVAKQEKMSSLMMDVYGVESMEELTSFDAKRGRTQPQRRLSGVHEGGADYEDTMAAPASALPWCLLPSVGERTSHTNPSFDVNGQEKSDNHPSYANPIRGRIPTLDQLGYEGWRTEIFRPDNSTPSGAADFIGGEEQAWQRLREWTEDYDGLTTYARYEDKISAKTRMTAMYKDHSSSKLSPYIASGCISPRSMMHYFREYVEKNRAQSGMAARWYNEAMVRLGRRDFAHFMGLRFGRSLFFPYGPRPEHTNDIPDWRCDEKIIRRWCAGLTGIPFCDAAMRELVNTGWVAHEGRQALTWLLTRGYGQDWRVAAEWFERCSLDYDPFLTYWWTATCSELIRDDFGEPVYTANYIAHHADQTGLYVKKWFPSMYKVPSTYIHRIHVLTPRMQEMHNVRLGKDYPYPIKLWEGGSTEEHGKLTGSQLKAYFATEKECSGTGWLEAHRFSSKIIPPEQLPLIVGPMASPTNAAGGGSLTAPPQQQQQAKLQSQ